MNENEPVVPIYAANGDDYPHQLEEPTPEDGPPEAPGRKFEPFEPPKSDA